LEWHIDGMEDTQLIRIRFEKVSPFLDERIRRLVAAAEAEALGRGGIPVSHEPKSLLRWTCKSTRQLAEALKRQGHQTSHRMVAEMLAELGYSLQGNRKTLEGEAHADGNQQFEYLHQQITTFQEKGQPAISVDTKKKELIGKFKNSGREWQPQGEPEVVETYDFPSTAQGKVAPYGVYDPTRNEG
jgi:hypothetical protein